ncbi:MAG: IS4 family transposase, partial [Cyanothece sp. SIO1E1]|nr:IS4 family transposase [Cyanothece sp. SIO1E1]
MQQTVAILKRKLAEGVGKPFPKLVNERVIEDALHQAKVKYRKRLFTPIVTIWAFLCQVLDPDKSLANGVKQLQCYLAVEAAEVPSL